MNIVNCPRCQKNDMTQNLGAIVQSGISTVETGGPSVGIGFAGTKPVLVGGMSSQTGTAVSQLAAMLMPPPQPKKSAFGCVGINIALLVFGISSFIVVFIGAKFMPGGIVAPLMAGIISLGFYFFMIIRANTAYPPKYEAWQRQMYKWSNSYYCSRDNVVFDTMTGDMCDPTQLNWYLNR